MEIKKIYHIEVTINDGRLRIDRKSENFTALELLGVLEHVKEDIFKQMRGEIKPEIVTRKVIERKGGDNLKKKLAKKKSGGKGTCKSKMGM